LKKKRRTKQYFDFACYIVYFYLLTNLNECIILVLVWITLLINYKTSLNVPSSIPFRHLAPLLPALTRIFTLYKNRFTWLTSFYWFIWVLMNYDLWSILIWNSTFENNFYIIKFTFSIRFKACGFCNLTIWFEWFRIHIQFYLILE